MHAGVMTRGYRPAQRHVRRHTADDGQRHDVASTGVAHDLRARAAVTPLENWTITETRALGCWLAAWPAPGTNRGERADGLAWAMLVAAISDRAHGQTPTIQRQRQRILAGEGADLSHIRATSVSRRERRARVGEVTFELAAEPSRC